MATMPIHDILRKYEIAPDTIESMKAFVKEWVQDLNSTSVAPAIRSIDYADLGEDSLHDILGFLNAAPNIIDTQRAPKEAIFCLLDLHKALTQASYRDNNNMQVISTTVECVEVKLALKARELLNRYNIEINNDTTQATSAMDVFFLGDEIHPLTIGVMNFVESIASEHVALNRLLRQSCLREGTAANGGMEYDMVRELVYQQLSDLKRKLREKSHLYSYSAVGAGFVHRNWKHVLSSIRRHVNTCVVRQVIQTDWVERENQELSKMQQLVFEKAGGSVFGVFTKAFF